MNEIRILSANDFDALARIFADACPGLKIVSDEERQRIKQRLLRLHEEEPAVHFHWTSWWEVIFNLASRLSSWAPFRS